MADRIAIEEFLRSRPVSAPTSRVLSEMVDLLAKGDDVCVIGRNHMLTTNEASDVLNVSRQYLMRLIDEGQIPFEKVGSHHRVRASDIYDFKRVRDTKREQGLRKLIAMTEEFGGYEGD